MISLTQRLVIQPDGCVDIWLITTNEQGNKEEHKLFTINNLEGVGLETSIPMTTLKAKAVPMHTYEEQPKKTVFPSIKSSI